MDKQNIEYIDLKNLILWSENPRDPISGNADNIDIIKNALANPNHKKWDLVNFSKSMGNDYDCSELPTVVLKDDRYIVYDGNRRVILGMLSKNIYNIEHNIKTIPRYPDKMPCNVCTEDFALSSIFRKHAGQSGTWSHLERDIFEHKYLKKEKSHFLLLDEATNVISTYPNLNQGFVRDEILTIIHLKKLGIEIIDGRVLTSNTNDENNKIFSLLSKMIQEKTISTRKNRKDIAPLLEDSRINEIISNNKSKSKCDITQQYMKKQPRNIEFTSSVNRDKHTPRIEPKIKSHLFGDKLILKSGNVNNLYRDLDTMYNLYKKDKFSKNFLGLIRMGLRLLVETACKETEYGKDINQYIKNNFSNAKKQLSEDQKATLSTQAIKDDSIIQLLHLGAHDYTASRNEEQTAALALIVGKILLITHGKNNSNE